LRRKPSAWGKIKKGKIPEIGGRYGASTELSNGRKAFTGIKKRGWKEGGGKPADKIKKLKKSPNSAATGKKKGDC